MLPLGVLSLLIKHPLSRDETMLLRDLKGAIVGRKAKLMTLALSKLRSWQVYPSSHARSVS